MQGALAAVAGINPQDEAEGMLAAQVVATPHEAMHCLRVAMRPKQSLDGQREFLNQANKLGRSYTRMMEALTRHRGKGQQKITVKHVHVNQGGQAIVGVVNQRKRPQKNQREEDAANRIAYQPEQLMRCADAQREPVPVAAGVWEEAL